MHKGPIFCKKNEETTFFARLVFIFKSCDHYMRNFAYHPYCFSDYFFFFRQVNNHVMEFYLLEFDVPLGNNQT